jgi:hypothetical protein
MRSWTNIADYTAITYQGTVPSKAILTSKGVEIRPKAVQLGEGKPEFPNMKEAGGVIPATTLGELIQKVVREHPPEFPSMKEAGGVIPAQTLLQEIQKTVREHQQEFLPLNNVIALIRQTTQFTMRSWFDSVPADAKQWPDPPHVEFANCAFDSPEDVKRFVESYGFGAGMIHQPPEEKETVLLHAMRFVEDYGFDDPYKQHPQRLTITANRLKQDQGFLRRYWGKAAQAEPLKQHFLWSPDDINFVNGKLQIILSDIWDYILVLFLIDLSKARLRVCENPLCRRLKYFVQERSDQKYCSTSCKNTVNVNRWLAISGNRDNWNAERRQARRPKPKTGRGRRR